MAAIFKSNNQNLLKNNQNLELGHYYRISGKTRPAHSYATPGAFDQEKWFIQRNIMSGFNVRYIEPLSLDEIYRLGYQQHLKEQQSFSNSFRLNIEKLRLTFRQILNSSSLQQKGLILALLTGDESLLSDETQLQFKQLELVIYWRSQAHMCSFCHYVILGMSSIYQSLLSSNLLMETETGFDGCTMLPWCFNLYCICRFRNSCTTNIIINPYIYWISIIKTTY